MNLSFIAPQIHNGERIVQLENEEVDKGTEKWSTAVITYIYH